MKKSKPSKADIRTLKKAREVLEEFERQQNREPQPISPLAGFNARQAIAAISGFIRSFD